MMLCPLADAFLSSRYLVCLTLGFSNTKSSRVGRVAPASVSSEPERLLAAKWRPGSAVRTGRKMAPAALPEGALSWEGYTQHAVFVIIPTPLFFLSWFWYPINRKRKPDSCYLKWNGKVIYTAIFLQDVVSCSKHSIKPLTNFSGA